MNTRPNFSEDLQRSIVTISSTRKLFLDGVPFALSVITDYHFRRSRSAVSDEFIFSFTMKK